MIKQSSNLDIFFFKIRLSTQAVITETEYIICVTTVSAFAKA